MCNSHRATSTVRAATVLSVFLFFCNFAHAAGDIEYSHVGWWDIKYREANNITGCHATALFKDQTTITMGLIQGRSKGWIVFLTNPKWQSWIAKNIEHTLVVVTISPNRNWRGTWFVNDSGMLYSSVKTEFINSLADANGITIYRANGRMLTSLSMKDSQAAIRSVVNCVREHPPAPSSPEAQVAQLASFGTAFFVAPHLLVTNHHVVKDCRGTIHVRYPDQKFYSATISGLDETNDLALLRTDLDNLSVATFRFGPRLGEQVASYGFPYAGLLSSSGNFTLGNVTSLSGMNDDSRFVQISTPVQPGNSGGPLVDMSGDVVGVIEGQLNAITLMRVDGSVPQNVNFAIQTPIVVNFLSTKGVKPKLDTDRHSDISSADVADLAKKFTVQIYCGETSSKTSEAAPTNKPSLSQQPSLSIEQKAKEYALALQAQWSRPNSEALAGLDAKYQDEVMYYGKMTKKDFIIKEKRAFVKRWPEREYRPKEPISVSCNNLICTVQGHVDFRAIDAARKTISEGEATFEYQLVMSGTAIKIRLENGDVQSRHRRSLSEAAGTH